MYLSYRGQHMIGEHLVPHYFITFRVYTNMFEYTVSLLLGYSHETWLLKSGILVCLPQSSREAVCNPIGSWGQPPLQNGDSPFLATLDFGSNFHTKTMENLRMHERKKYKNHITCYIYISAIRGYIFSSSFHLIDGVIERFNKYMNLE